MRYLLDERTKDQVVEAAGADTASHCDVSFYLGEQFLAGGEKEAARVMLRTAADICPVNFVERSLARAELSRL